MTLNYIWDSDILKEPSDLIVQQLNCVTSRGRGLSKIISDAIPYANFYPYKGGKAAPIGTISIRGDSNNQRVCGMYAQYYPGKATSKSIGRGEVKDSPSQRLLWFRGCLELLKEWCFKMEVSIVSFPYNIGCDLAGGDWNKYRDALESFALSVSPNIKVYIVSINPDPGMDETRVSQSSHSTDEGDDTGMPRLDRIPRIEAFPQWGKLSLLEHVYNNPIGGNWDEIILDGLSEVSEKLEFFANEGRTIYPPIEKVFEPFRRLAFDKVKVVIIGQDPYHGKGQATGVAFAVEKGVPKPPSLRNIIKEAKSEGFHIDDIADLLDQGVLLINTSLTVEEGKPGSHSEVWSNHTIKLLKAINQGPNDLVVMLWGGHAQSYSRYFDNKRHSIISSSHPSPLSANRGFFGSKPFTSINDALIKLGNEPLNMFTLEEMVTEK